MVLQIVKESTILRTTIVASMCCSTSLFKLPFYKSNICDRTMRIIAVGAKKVVSDSPGRQVDLPSG